MNTGALLLTVFATAGLPSADGTWLVPHIEITQARLRSAGDSAGRIQGGKESQRAITRMGDGKAGRRDRVGGWRSGLKARRERDFNRKGAAEV